MSAIRLIHTYDAHEGYLADDGKRLSVYWIDRMGTLYWEAFVHDADGRFS